jgi:hypothetical protein
MLVLRCLWIGMTWVRLMKGQFSWRCFCAAECVVIVSSGEGRLWGLSETV